MKITRSQLGQIIREEAEHLAEAGSRSTSSRVQGSLSSVRTRSVMQLHSRLVVPEDPHTE